MKINFVLASLVGDVQKELAEIWLLLGLLNRYLNSVEKSIINFSMEKARDAAWSFVDTLSPQSAEHRQQQIVQKDKMVSLFSNDISRSASS